MKYILSIIVQALFSSLLDYYNKRRMERAVQVKDELENKLTELKNKETESEKSTKIELSTDSPDPFAELRNIYANDSKVDK